MSLGMVFANILEKHPLVESFTMNEHGATVKLRGCKDTLDFNSETGQWTTKHIPF